MMMFGFNINNPTNKQHYGVTIAVFAVILSIGATLTSLGRVFDVIGGFSSTVLGKYYTTGQYEIYYLLNYYLLVFLIPGCAYIYLFSFDLFSSLTTNKKTQSLLVEQEEEKIKASWKLYILSVISVIVAIPVIYFSVKDAIFE
jgi:hypothetical protein